MRLSNNNRIYTYVTIVVHDEKHVQSNYLLLHIYVQKPNLWYHMYHSTWTLRATRHIYFLWPHGKTVLRQFCCNSFSSIVSDKPSLLGPPITRNDFLRLCYSNHSVRNGSWLGKWQKMLHIILVVMIFDNHIFCDGYNL